jgi:predicted nuclease with TOPRIM domain
LQQREWDAMEAKILEAEQELAACQRELESFASDANRVAEAYQKMQNAQGRVEDLYARWAELEGLVAK